MIGMLGASKWPRKNGASTIAKQMNTTQNETKHTPTPWQAIEWSCHAPTSIAYISGSTNIPVAECAGIGGDTDDAIANAAFIVRACNEHAALCVVAEAAKAIADLTTASGIKSVCESARNRTQGTYEEALQCVLGKQRVAIESALANLAAIRKANE